MNNSQKVHHRNFTSLSIVTTIRVLIASSIIMIATEQIQAEIIYSLIDGAAGSQGGHTVSGTVTFDTVCGASCTSANVEDFTFSITGPKIYSYSRSAANDVLINGAALNAAADGLFYNFDSPSYTELTLRNSSAYAPVLTWQTNSTAYLSYAPDFIPEEVARATLRRAKYAKRWGGGLR